MVFFKPSFQILKSADGIRRFAPALLCVIFTAFSLAPHAFAGEADVIKVKAQERRGNVWRFAVTLRHADEGWDHYANNWEILSPDGEIIAVRSLGHPHVDEQPFTRSLSGVKIPQALTHVIIRARDSVHGYGGQMMRVDLKTGKAEVVEAPKN